MQRSSTLRFFSIVLAAVVCAALAPVAAAQEAADDGTGDTTTTTEFPPSTSTSTTLLPAPGDGSTSTTAPPTTVPYLPPIPPELIEDPRLPFLIDPGPSDGLDIPIAQLPFDPATVAVLPERIEAATAALEAAQAALGAVQADLAARSAHLAGLHDRLDVLDRDVRGAVEAAAAARRALRDHAVAAYMVGPVEDQLLLLRSTDAVDMGVARSYVEVVADSRQRLVLDYRAKSAGLSAEHAQLAASLGEADSELAEKSAELPGAFDAVLGASRELAAYEAGAHAYVAGFVFPVAGEVEFIDSWGFPRMMGTSSAHWHQGSDIFAPAGTPLVAAEDGVLDRVGTASLGGIKLWVIGDSGNAYYYAHLSAFAEGVAEGKRIRAGEVIGFVGDTGNARGTSPHLHFEVHPGGVGPVNPYPLLKAAYGARPIARAVVPTIPTPPPAAPPGTPSAPATPPRR